ncbi:hypothetical protein [Glutamicibacter protophormiae]|nr:hypothetical protein [Glutamicibacter protophormiae]
MPVFPFPWLAGTAQALPDVVDASAAGLVKAVLQQSDAATAEL